MLAPLLQFSGAVLVLWFVYYRFQQRIQLYKHFPWKSQFIPGFIAVYLPKWLYDGPITHNQKGVLFTKIAKQYYQTLGPIYALHFAHASFVVVSDPDFGKLINSKGQKVFSKGRQVDIIEELFGNNIFSTFDVDLWSRHRRLLDPAFTDQSLKGVVKATNMVMDEFFSVVSKQNFSFNSVDYMSSIALDVLGYAGFNYAFDAVKHPGQNPVLQATNDIFAQAVFYSLTPTKWLRGRLNIGPMKVVKDSAHVFSSTVSALIESRNDANNKSIDFMSSTDILSLLLNATDDQDEQLKPLTKKELVADLFVFLIAGQETTGRTLTFCLYLLAKHKEIQQQAQKLIDEVLQGRTVSWEDLDKLEFFHMLMRETLRLYPVASFIMRQTMQDVEFKEYTIPKNSMVVYHWSNFQQDEKYWDNPHEFNPNRFAKEGYTAKETPFGIGARNCIGRIFAKYEFMTAVIRILQSYQVELVDPTFEMDTMLFLTLQPTDKVMIKLVPR